MTGFEMRHHILKARCPFCYQGLDYPTHTLFAANCPDCKIHWTIRPRPSEPWDDPVIFRVEAEPLAS